MSKTTIMVLASAVLTAILASPVRSYAISHHQQFNAGTVLLLFAAILAVFAMVYQFRQLVVLALEASDDE